MLHSKKQLLIKEWVFLEKRIYVFHKYVFENEQQQEFDQESEKQKMGIIKKRKKNKGI